MLPDSTVNIRSRKNRIRFFLLIGGIIGILFFLSADLIRYDSPQFGKYQLAGLVISTIIILASVRSPESPSSKTWFGAIFFTYLTGLLFMGLWPSGHFHSMQAEFLNMKSPPIDDFIINVLGFVPFAYLSMTYLITGRQHYSVAKLALLVFVIGMGTSFFIEVSQYFIPGRTSSMMDLLANSVGAIVGVASFAMEQKIAGFGLKRR